MVDEITCVKIPVLLAALRWMMQTKGMLAVRRKGSGCVKSQTYQGAASK